MSFYIESMQTHPPIEIQTLFAFANPYKYFDGPLFTLL